MLGFVSVLRSTTGIGLYTVTDKAITGTQHINPALAHLGVKVQELCTGTSKNYSQWNYILLFVYVFTKAQGNLEARAKQCVGPNVGQSTGEIARACSGVEGNQKVVHETNKTGTVDVILIGPKPKHYTARNSHPYPSRNT
jgi:hypothetical protein